MVIDVKLNEIRTAWHKVEMGLEMQIEASFPHPGDDEGMREIFRTNIGRDDLGMDAHWVGDTIHFAYPALILVGVKTA